MASKLQIPNAITRPGMKKSDAEDKWKKIEEAIHQIYNQNASSLSFQTLYTSAYHIVLNKFGDVLYDGVQSTFKSYIEGVRETIMRVVDGMFLHDLLVQWNKHKTAVGMVRDILMYLDRNHVPSKKKTPIFEMGIRLFGQEVFHKSTLDRIQRLIMDIIRKDRDGEQKADIFLLKTLTQMMIDISKKDVYTPHFEAKFIEESTDYFKTEAAHFFETCTATDYLHKVTERLRQEKERTQKCMDPETRPKIEDVVKKTMINDYKESIIDKEGSGVKTMLQDWRVADLRLVFEVLGLVPGALQPCVDLVYQFGQEQGYNIVKDKEKDEKPLDLVEELIALREKYDKLLLDAFSEHKNGEVVRNPDFATAIKKAFDDIVNENERLPEYLSLFVDSKLKKGAAQIGESEFDTLFDQVIALFRHLREKDLFEKYYKTHLAKRLLADRSQSDDAEKSFISKLKTEFGYQFTTKLEGMFNDMRISRENGEYYNNYLEQNGKKPAIDITVQVLTTGYWPVTTGLKVIVPNEITESCKIYEDFYYNKHSGRRLTWQFNMGTGDLRANGYDKRYELNVTTFQMCILLLFNDTPKLTYQQLLDVTKIPSGELKKNIFALCVKSKTHDKVLNKSDEGSVLNKDTTFEPNPEFKSNLIKVKIQPVVLKESAEQVKETVEKVDEERKYQLDAAIVRIMKARKSLEHRDLVIEVTKQLQHRFMPPPDLIKKRIESLIEREYLERCKDNRSKYNYLA